MTNLEDINELEIKLDFEDIIKETCDDLAQKIKNNALNINKRGTGEYANNWTFKIVKKGKDKIGVVYNKDTYRLSHLLEFGHIKANKYKRSNERTAPAPHVKPAYDDEKPKFIKKMSACRYEIKVK